MPERPAGERISSPKGKLFIGNVIASPLWVVEIGFVVPTPLWGGAQNHHLYLFYISESTLFPKLFKVYIKMMFPHQILSRQGQNAIKAKLFFQAHKKRKAEKSIQFVKQISKFSKWLEGWIVVPGSTLISITSFNKSGHLNKLRLYRIRLHFSFAFMIKVDAKHDFKRKLWNWRWMSGHSIWPRSVKTSVGSPEDM